MSKFKSLLHSFNTTRAQRKRNCHHNKKHIINAGEFVLEIIQGFKKQNYCLICAKEIIKNAKVTISEIEKNASL